MKYLSRRLMFRQLGIFFLSLVFGPLASAQTNWELGYQRFRSSCDSCHNYSTIQAGRPALANKTVEQISSAFKLDPMKGFEGTISADERGNLAEYFSRGIPDIPIASLVPIDSTDFGSVPVGVNRTRSLSFELRNSGTAPLTVSGISVDDGLNFSVASGLCSPVAVGKTCNIVVAFRPQSVGSLSERTLTVNTNTRSGSVSISSLSGKGEQPFTLTPALTLPITAEIAATSEILIKDYQGDPIKICRIPDSVNSGFSFPADFTLDSPGSLDANGCYTHPGATVAVGSPREISVVVRFRPGATGPRFASLRFERLGTGTSTVSTVALQGNPGAFVALSASHLFDELGDPGVEVDNNNTLSRTVRVENRGSSPLSFSPAFGITPPFAISGRSAGEYRLAGTGCQTVSSLAAFSGGGRIPSCELTILFDPAEVGLRRADLTITPASGEPQIVALNGLGVRGPRLTVRRGVDLVASGQTFAFGAQTVGGLYPGVEFTLVNGGTQGDLEVVVPSSSSVPGFGVTSSAGCSRLAPSAEPPSAECKVTVRAEPAAVQAYVSPLLIKSRAAGTTTALQEFRLELRGQGTAAAVPVLSWTDAGGATITQLTFPETQAGSPRTATVRLFNAGPGGARLQIGNTVGFDSTNFALDTSACGNNRDLFQGDSCTVSVSFAPGTAGAKSVSAQYLASIGTGLLPISSPYLAITGRAIASSPAPLLETSVAAHVFPTTTVGSSSAPVEIRLRNSGSRPLSVLSYALSAPFALQSRTCADVPFVIQPGGECTVSALFRPTTEGTTKGILQITSDATSPVTSIALDGPAEATPEVSGGGCSISDGRSGFDPTLWCLVFASVWILLHRRRLANRSSAEEDGLR